MQKQGGNFLLQALLALSLVIAFMPLLAKKLADRNKSAEMYATTTQLETAETAARIYLRENIESLNYSTVSISDDKFSDTLEPYGLPLGFVPRTIFNQKISLVINKTEQSVDAQLQLSGGNLSKIQRAELVRRIGFYAYENNGDIFIKVPFEEIFSDLVKRDEKKPDDNGFLSDLNMGTFSIENSSELIARNGEFESYQTNSLSVFGTEIDRKVKNKIENINTGKSVFQTNAGEAALSITRGTLSVDNISTKTISKFGTTGTLNTQSAAVYDFSLSAGSSSFYGPPKWEVKGNLIADKISFSVEKLEIESLINASAGQDVFIDSDSLEYSSNSGIQTDIIRTANITLRDQTSESILNGGTGAVVLDIRPAGTSVLPDVLLTGTNNDSISIISKPSDANSDTVTCKSIISSLDGAYNTKSVSQNLICQYVFWQRLEKRINIKECLMAGKSDCE